MDTERLEIPLTDASVDAVRALLQDPGSDAGHAAILFAHGAGAPLDSAFMEAIASGLAAGGHPVLRFNYAYTERMQREDKRRPPDRRPLLEKVHAAALETLRERFAGRPVILAGKSMGARISSLLSAAGTAADGLAFFGYPLHAPGRTESLRDAHFPEIDTPALFLQGTRDALCKLELLRPSLEKLPAASTLEVIEDADHDFKVPKRTGRTREEVLEELVGHALAWARALS